MKKKFADYLRFSKYEDNYQKSINAFKKWAKIYLCIIETVLYILTTYILYNIKKDIK